MKSVIKYRQWCLNTLSLIFHQNCFPLIKDLKYEKGALGKGSHVKIFEVTHTLMLLEIYPISW